MCLPELMWRQLKNIWKTQISWLWRKITCQSKYSVWMKPPYSGNKCLKGLSSIKEAKSMPGFKASKDRTTVLLGGNVAGYKLKLLWPGTVRTPRPSGISVSRRCQYTRCQDSTGRVRSHGWLSSPSKMLSWIAVLVKWRCAIWKITYLSRLCVLLVMLLDIFLLLVIFIPKSKWWFSLQIPLFDPING